MRLTLIAALLLAPAAVRSQSPPPKLTAADSALVGRILLAEDRRDTTDTALVEGEQHRDPRVQVLARRARARITDPQFASRDSFPALRPPPAWPEPEWRLRYRALAEQKDDCQALRTALTDSVWHVRLRAVDLISMSCWSDDSLVNTLRDWVDSLSADASSRARGQVSWHAAAHAIVALARVRPAGAKRRIPKLAAHNQWQVRAYAARAAAIISDTARLRALARDPNDNVKEVAIEGLSKVAGHAADEVYIEALGAKGAQAVRAAAKALAGSKRAGVRAAANAAFERWAAKNIASARDARVALLEAAGRPASDDRPPSVKPELPPDAVELALGSEVRLRVTMARSSGGGGFTVRLRGDVAPIMAARILALARSGYYDGLTWQRVEPDFVIQGGSPGANEYVGLAQYLRDELGTVPHLRGTVGMSTRGHDTGDAQWFVNLKDNLRLQRDYTVFGEVIDGIDVVDGIMEGDQIVSIRSVRNRP
jgi:cyclophilin family peptidyl-prolyl cis-trans isomerase